MKIDVSGTLHLYSGHRREMFFVFDDDVASRLYTSGWFDLDNPESRRATISVGGQRAISRRTLSFSRKQAEIKVSLCSAGSVDGLGALEALYRWFVGSSRKRPKPFRLLGSLSGRVSKAGMEWELLLQEPEGLIVPPGLPRRTKLGSKARRRFERRRRIIERDLLAAGLAAERVAYEVANADYPRSAFHVSWRTGFLDSEHPRLRELGILADIDIWRRGAETPVCAIEVKAQQIVTGREPPRFFLSSAEWRSYQEARRRRLRYEVWLFRYSSIKDFALDIRRVELWVFSRLEKCVLQPDGYAVVAVAAPRVVYTLVR